MSQVQPELQAYLLNVQHDVEFSDGLGSSEANDSCNSSVYDSASLCDVENKKKGEKLTKPAQKTLKDSNNERSIEPTNSYKQKNNYSAKSSDRKSKNSKRKSKAKRQKFSESQLYPGNELFSNESILKLLQLQDSTKLHQYSSYSPGESLKRTNNKSVDSGIDLNCNWNQFQDGGKLLNFDVNSDEESFTEDQLTLIQSVLSHDKPDDNVCMLSNDGLLTTSGDTFHSDSIEQSCSAIQRNDGVEVNYDSPTYSSKFENLVSFDGGICDSIGASSSSKTSKQWDTETCIQGVDSTFSSTYGVLDNIEILLTNQNELGNELSSESHGNDNDIQIVNSSKSCSPTCDNNLLKLEVNPGEENVGSFPSRTTEYISESSEVVHDPVVGNETCLVSQPTNIEYMDIDIQQEVEITQPISDNNNKADSRSITDEIKLENDMKLVKKSRSRRRANNSTRTAKSSAQTSTQANRKGNGNCKANKRPSKNLTPAKKQVRVSETSYANSSKITNPRASPKKFSGEESTPIELDITLDNNSSLEMITVNGFSESQSLNSSKVGKDSHSPKLFIDTKSRTTTGITSQESTLLRTEGCMSSQLSSDVCKVDSSNRNDSLSKAEQLTYDTCVNNTLSNNEVHKTIKLPPNIIKANLESNSSSKTSAARKTTCTISSDKGNTKCSPEEIELPDDLNINPCQKKELTSSAIDYLMQMDDDDVNAAIDIMLSSQFKSLNASRSTLLPTISNKSCGGDYSSNDNNSNIGNNDNVVSNIPNKDSIIDKNCKSLKHSSISSVLHNCGYNSDDDISKGKNDSDDNVVSDSPNRDSAMDNNCNSITLSSVSTVLNNSDYNSRNDNKNKNKSGGNVLIDSLKENSVNIDNNQKSVPLSPVSTVLHNSDCNSKNDGKVTNNSTITKDPNVSDKSHSKENYSNLNSVSAVLYNGHHSSDDGGDDVNSNMVDVDDTKMNGSSDDKKQSEVTTCVDDNHNSYAVAISKDKNTTPNVNDCKSNIVAGINYPATPNAPDKNHNTNKGYQDSSYDDDMNTNVVDCESNVLAINDSPTTPNATDKNQNIGMTSEGSNDKSATNDDTNMDSTDENIAFHNNFTEDDVFNSDSNTNNDNSSCKGTCKTGGYKSIAMSLFDSSDCDTEPVYHQFDDSVGDNSKDPDDLDDGLLLPEVEFCEMTINNCTSQTVGKDPPFLPSERPVDAPTELTTVGTEYSPLKSKGKGPKPFLPTERELGEHYGQVTSKKHEALLIEPKEKIMKYFTSTPKFLVKKTVKKVKKVVDVPTNESEVVVMTEERKKYFLDKFINNGKKLHLRIQYLPIKSKKKTNFKVLPRNSTLTNQIGQTFSNTPSTSNNSLASLTKCLSTSVSDGLTGNVPDCSSVSTGDCLTKKDGDKFQRAINIELNLSIKSCTEDMNDAQHSLGKDLRTEKDLEENEMDPSRTEKESSNENCGSVMFEGNCQYQSTRDCLQHTSRIPSKQRNNMQTSDEMDVQFDGECQIEKDFITSENEPSESEQHSDIAQDHKVTANENAPLLEASDYYREKDAKQMENAVTHRQVDRETNKDDKVYADVAKIVEEIAESSEVEMGQESCSLKILHTDKGSHEREVEVNPNFAKISELADERKNSSAVEMEPRSSRVEMIYAQKESNENDVEVKADTIKFVEQVANNFADYDTVEMEPKRSCFADQETSEVVFMDITENKIPNVVETESKTFDYENMCNNDIEMEAAKHEECKQGEEMVNGSPKQLESTDRNHTTCEKDQSNNNFPEELASMPLKQHVVSHLNKQHSDGICNTSLLEEGGSTKQLDKYHAINDSGECNTESFEPTTDKTLHDISHHDEHNQNNMMADPYEFLIDTSKSIITTDHIQAEGPSFNISDTNNITLHASMSEQVDKEDFIHLASTVGFNRNRETSVSQDSNCHSSETSTSEIVKSTPSCFSTKNQEYRSELSATAMDSNKVSVDDNGVSSAQGETHSFTKDDLPCSSMNTSHKEPDLHTITKNMDNNNVSSNNAATNSSKKIKSTSRKRTCVKLSKETASPVSKKTKFKMEIIPKEMSFASQEDEGNTSKHDDEVPQLKHQSNNKNKLIHKYYKEKVKNLKKENELLRNKSAMFDWITDLKHEIRYLKRSVEMLQRRSDEQESVIYSQELAIHKLEQRIGLMNNQASHPSSSSSLKVIHERQDVTITSSDTNTR